MRSASSAAAVGLALICAACAHGPPGRHGGRHGPGGPHGEGEGPGGAPRAQLFISPSGQPFRAPPGAPYPVVVWFAQADADHDGRLTREEFRADADAYFPTLDPDGDGKITLTEVTRYERDIAPEITGFAMDGGERGGGHGGGGGGFNGLRQGAAAYSLINEPHPIRGADADLSFDVTRAEWRAAADRRFARLDTDVDGALTLAELPRSPADRTPHDEKGRR